MLVSSLLNSCPAALHGSSGNLFFAVISSLFAAQCSLTTPLVDDYGKKLNDGEEFDFIVVGGGSTGSVVVNRLSENTKWKILLLEAGGDPSVATQVPLLWSTLTGSSEDWAFKSEPQNEACQGFEDQVCQLTTGKVLGGGSSINAMTYIRGNKMDYDNWEKLGNIGWGWSSVLKYFKKSEHNLQFGNSTKYHGTQGYLKVGSISSDCPIKKIITKAASEMGYEKVDDFNGKQWVGYGDAQGTVAEGIRASGYNAFIYSVKERPNLYIAKNAFVTKLAINSINKTCEAVQVSINKAILTIKARKEIIVSAGALSTPKILMLSGIGPTDQLQEMKIPSINDLPVGENLQDHVSFIGLFVAIRPNKTDWKAKEENMIDNIYKYLMHREGPFATIGLTSFYGFINTIQRKAKYPNIQFHHEFFEKGFLQGNPTFLINFKIDATIASNMLELNKKDDILFLTPAILNPKSRGSVHLRSSNPLDTPRVITNYLTEESDVKTLIDSILYVQNLLKTKEFGKYNPEIMDIKIPGCSDKKFMSIAYYKCALSFMSMTNLHFSGTAKMGPGFDATAVVNPRLQVRGIKGLRVADASIMPTIISGNINAACFMIGDKAADMIKEDWLRQDH